MNIRSVIAIGLTFLAWPTPLHGQSVMDRSPNLQGVWGLNSGQSVFVLAHRFEVRAGGDELFTVPTLTLATGIPFGFALGADFTTFSESVPETLTGNEAQLWLKRPIGLTQGFDAALLGGYNTAAKSADAAANVRLATRRFQLFGEVRTFSSLFGSGDFGAAAAIGAGVRLTEHLAVTGDFGQVLTEDGIPSAWSAALAMEIPGSPHTISFLISNTGATTLHGASREKVAGTEDLRYGFTFTVPVSPPSMWARIFRPLSDPGTPAAGARPVQIRQFAYGPAQITVRAGDSIEWVNLDPDTHTVTADDGSWDSGGMADGQRFSRSFSQPGRYEYHCAPHPGMRGVVIVTP